MFAMLAIFKGRVLDATKNTNFLLENINVIHVKLGNGNSHHHPFLGYRGNRSRMITVTYYSGDNLKYSGAHIVDAPLEIANEFRDTAKWAFAHLSGYTRIGNQIFAKWSDSSTVNLLNTKLHVSFILAPIQTLRGVREFPKWNMLHQSGTLTDRLTDILYLQCHTDPHC